MFPFMFVLEGEIDVPFHEGLVSTTHEVEQTIPMALSLANS